jgi:hypothetical protein
MAKYDELSFKKAFAAARAELGKSATFTWKGKSYSTRLADEPAKAPKKDVAPKTSVRPRAKPPTGDAMKGYRAGDIKTTTLPNPNTRPTGRGDGSKEVIQRAAQRALDKSAAASKYPATDNAAILLARRIRESVSGQGGISDRGSKGPTVSSAAPRQGTAPTTPGIKIVRPKARPEGMTKPKPLTGAEMSDPKKRKEYAAAMAAYNRSLKG